MSLEVGVQSKNVVYDENPGEGFENLRRAGFTCCDFSLNYYQKNTDLYQGVNNRFFARSVEELESFFAPHKEGAQAAGIRINQMHMPYPTYIPTADRELNDYLWNEVAPKSMEVCRFLGCHNVVIHGF